MISRLQLKNFTVFAEADLEFSPQLNVIVGENGTGKTHLLKVMYALTSPLTAPAQKTSSADDVYTSFTKKLERVFQIDSTKSLIRKATRRLSEAEIHVYFNNGIEHEQAWVTLSQPVNTERPPTSLTARPISPTQGLTIYLPPQEVLSLSPSFVALYDRYTLPFDETLRDCAEILSLPPLRKKSVWADRATEELNKVLGGEVVVGSTGIFSLKTKQGVIEAPLLAHGFKKIAALAQLIANGSIQRGSILFWDEPEANLNPRLVRQLAWSIMILAHEGVQVFIATHSLFLLKELEILGGLSNTDEVKTRYFGLHRGKNGVVVEQGDTPYDMGPIAALEEELEQTDRFLAANDVARNRSKAE